MVPSGPRSGSPPHTDLVEGPALRRSGGVWDAEADRAPAGGPGSSGVEGEDAPMGSSGVGRSPGVPRSEGPSDIGMRRREGEGVRGTGRGVVLPAEGRWPGPHGTGGCAILRARAGPGKGVGARRFAAPREANRPIGITEPTPRNVCSARGESTSRRVSEARWTAPPAPRPRSASEDEGAPSHQGAIRTRPAGPGAIGSGPPPCPGAGGPGPRPDPRDRPANRPPGSPTAPAASGCRC